MTGKNTQERENRILVLSLQPYRFATRSRKVAETMSNVAEVLFLSPSAIGRAGQWDKAGRRTSPSGVHICQLPAKKAHERPTKANVLRNIATVYVPLGLRLLREVLKTPADTVFSTSLALAPLAMIHSRRFKSRLIVDVTERPGAATVPGSTASVVAKADRVLLKRLQHTDALLTTVTVADTHLLKGKWELPRVELVRNVPQSDWRATYYPPDSKGLLSLVAIGSIFESRGYELLIDAMARCKERGLPVRLALYGRGREGYIEELKDRIHRLGIEDFVSFEGALERDQVSETYLKYDVGVIAYEPTNISNDGLSNKLMECVSTGRPVIAADLPENRQFVTQYGVGELAEMTVEGIVEAASRMFKRPDRVELSQHCRALGDSELNWESEFAPVQEYMLKCN